VDQNIHMIQHKSNIQLRMQNPILTPLKFQNLFITQTKIKSLQHAALKQTLNQRDHRGVELRPGNTQTGSQVHHLAPCKNGSAQPVNNASGRIVLQISQELLSGASLSLGCSVQLERHGLIGGELAAEVGGREGVEDEDGVGADAGGEEDLGDGVGAGSGDGEGEGGEEDGGGKGEDVGGVVGEGEGEFGEEEGGRGGGGGEAVEEGEGGRREGDDEEGRGEGLGLLGAGEDEEG